MNDGTESNNNDNTIANIVATVTTAPAAAEVVHKKEIWAFAC